MTWIGFSVTPTVLRQVVPPALTRDPHTDGWKSLDSLSLMTMRLPSQTRLRLAESARGAHEGMPRPHPLWEAA